MAHIILNHTLVQAENAFVSINDRGFRYGDGAFETIAIENGVPYHFEWHMKRLASALAALRISFDTNCLADECQTLLAENQANDGLLRIQITRGNGGRGYLPTPAEPTCVIETLPCPAAPDKAVSLQLSPYTKIPTTSLPAEKLCQGVNSTLARMHAAEQGCFEALMLTHDGYLSEASSGNLFWFKNGTLYTPSLECGCISGSMRAAILGLSSHPVKEVKETVAALHDAEAVFITNVAWKALPVDELKPVGWRWNSQPLANHYLDLITKDISRESREYAKLWKKDTAA